MVFSGEEEEGNMATGSERVKPLHNFMLPCLKWGTQRHLRCMKIASDEGSPSESEKKRSKINADDDGIGAVREKLMLDLKTEADRLKDAILRKEKENNGGGEDYEVEVEVATAARRERTWNLRTRKGVFVGGGGGESGKGLLLNIDEKKPNVSVSPLRNGNGGVNLKGGGDSNKKMKFSLTLTKKEIEEDFMKMVGHRPPRRPKKRPRIVQRQMDTLFPGMWLSEVSADAYKVPDGPENNGKK
ncbi:unnamed protein product [Vicia faba]|uniref:DUF1639 family protein n=1 Tax=Vicia faba TaxID=3906 RepID=A0AAV1A347_VICFA|nr:unnamed protein product [Vicia faba]